MADEHSNDTTPREADTASAGTGWTGDATSELSDIQRTLSALGTRIDALVTSTTSYRSAVTDRLVEYTDTISNLIRNQSGDIDEERTANQRLLADLQQGVAASERTMTALGDRIDKLQAGDPDADSSRVLAELRSVLDAQEGLTRFLTEALDQFGDRVTKTLTTTHEGSVQQLGGLTRVIEGVANSESKLLQDVRELSESIRGIRESMVDVASGEVVGALWDEVRSLRDSLESAPAEAEDEGSPVAAIESLAADVAGVREALAAGVGSPVEAIESLAADVAGVREALAEVGSPLEAIESLAADVAGLRADFTEGLVIEPSGAMGETIDEIRAEVVRIAAQISEATSDADADADADADDDDELRAEIESLTDAVRTLLEQAELVDEEGEPLTDDDASDGDDDPDSGWDVGAQTGGGGESVAGSLASVRELVEAARAEVSGITERLDEGLILDLEPSPEQREMVEQLAGLRADMADRVTIDLDPVLERIEAIRDDVAQLSTTATSTFDPDAIDVLREEIQALATVAAPAPDDLVESLRDELVALRRRIKLRAEADVLSDEQLEIIAEAVANRLR